MTGSARLEMQAAAPQRNVRLDKWLWAVRLYQTRSLACQACRQGRVTLLGQPLKPAREVRINDVISARTGGITRTFRVLALLDRRVGASADAEFAEDLTPASEYAKRDEPRVVPLFARPKGMGRPTKSERRLMERLLGGE